MTLSCQRKLRHRGMHYCHALLPADPTLRPVPLDAELWWTTDYQPIVMKQGFVLPVDRDDVVTSGQPMVC